MSKKNIFCLILKVQAQLLFFGYCVNGYWSLSNRLWDSLAYAMVKNNINKFMSLKKKRVKDAKEKKWINVTKRAFCVRQWLITGKCVCRYVKYFSKNCYLLLIKQICEKLFFCLSNIYIYLI